jgi:hypothetical protein
MAQVGSQGPHKTKVHVKPLLLLNSPHSRPLRRQFTNSCLSLEINKMKRVMFKDWGNSRSITGKASGGAKMQ